MAVQIEMIPTGHVNATVRQPRETLLSKEICEPSKPSLASNRKIKEVPYHFRAHHNNKIKSLKSVSNPASLLSDVGIQGMSKLFNHKYHTFVKIVWALAITSTTVCCITQMTRRLQVYFEVPYTVNMNMEREVSTEYPAITVCPYYPFTLSRKFADYRQTYADHFNISGSPFELQEKVHFLDLLWFPELNVSTLWEMTRLDVPWQEQQIICHQFSAKKNCEISIWYYPLVSYLGWCWTIFVNDSIYYDGPYNGLQLNFRTNVNLYSGIEIMAILHHLKVVYKHYLYKNTGLYVPTFKWTELKYRLKKYRRFNTTRRICKDTPAADKCFNICIETLISTDITCRLPYMTMFDIPMCLTPEEAKATYNRTITIYETMDRLCTHCPKHCDEVFYITTNSVTSSLKGVTRLAVMYPDNLVDVVTEIPTCSFETLLSDFGGALGLFLGVSLLSLLQLFESILCFLKHKLGGFFSKPGYDKKRFLKRTSGKAFVVKKPLLDTHE